MAFSAIWVGTGMISTNLLIIHELFQAGVQRRRATNMDCIYGSED